MKEPYLYIAIPTLSVLLLGLVFTYFVFRAVNGNNRSGTSVQPSPVVYNPANTAATPTTPSNVPEHSRPVITPQLFGTEFVRVPLSSKWSIVEEEYPYGETLLIKPAQQANIKISDSSLRITIEKNVSTARLKEIEELYSRRKFNSTKEIVHGQQATRYTGILFGPDTSGDVSTIQDVAFVFLKESNLVWITYHYLGDIPDNNIENEFEEIIQNMTLL